MTSPSNPLEETEYAEYHKGYVDLAPEHDVLSALRFDRDAMLEFFRPLSDEKMNYRYREGAWNCKELIQHITDTERVFAFRAMSFARGDQGPFPGFDHEDYVNKTDVSTLSKEQLMFDFVLHRNALISMFTNFTEAAWLRKGRASGEEVSVRALPRIILGHSRHHQSVIAEKYLG